MRPDNSSRSFITPARRLLLTCTLGCFLLAVQPAAAQPPGLNHARGHAAIAQLATRLPAVAAQHNMAAARLRELFLSDPYLAVDEADNLLFIDEFTPEEAAGAAGTAEGAALALQPLPNTFFLHSLHGATKVIYLDFDGHTTTGTSWNSGATIVSEPYSIDADAAFSATELERIQYIWQRVAEDFLPYGVDVTTQDPGVEPLRKLGTGDQAWGVRVVVSPTNWYNTGAGGVAYIGSFSWGSDTPCFVFTAQLGNGNEKYTAEAATHEAGHTVGLYHDGVTGGSAYYSGHNGWAAVMGVGYYQGLVQWSKGEYPGANNGEDDLTIMTGYGFTYRPDDHGNTAALATPLVVTNSTSVSGGGIIERPTDMDHFSFLTGAGTITLNVAGAARSPNLDIKAELYDSVGVIVANANSSASLNASISLFVAAGNYTLVIDGVGNGDLVTGYSEYGSLGAYSISGTIINPGVAQPPVAVLSATPTSGAAPLEVTFNGSGSYDPDGTISVWSWNFGDGTALDPDTNPSHAYLSKGTYTAVLTVTDRTGFSDTAGIVITATGPPNVPTGLSAAAASASQINLSWTDMSDDETGFAIERSTGGGTWALLATVGANVPSYANTGLTASTTYQYRVRAVNGAGESGYTNTAGATTQAALAMHIGDLDGTRSVSKRTWSAKVTITVHDASERTVPGAVVTGTWNTGGSGSCTTGTTGACTITASKIATSTASVTFTVGNVTKAGANYTSGHHDPDGDSSGTTITILKQSAAGG
jgi:PKD repeat protein